MRASGVCLLANRAELLQQLRHRREWNSRDAFPNAADSHPTPAYVYHSV